jgi:hypothetical protein
MFAGMDRIEAIVHGNPLRVERMRPSGLADLVVETAREDYAFEWLARVGTGGVVICLATGREPVSWATPP